MPQCKAKSKRSGVRCLKASMKGKKLCSMHGGKSLSGADLPQFKHGRYSKSLPDQLTAQYHAALADKDLISLNDEIALTDTRMVTIFSRLEGLSSIAADSWQRAQNLYRSFRRHTNRNQQALAIQALDDLGTLLEESQTDEAVWRDINELIEQRRRLVDTERRLVSDGDRAIAVDKVMMLMAAVIDIVRRHVASREARGAIAGEIRSLVSGSNGVSERDSP